MPATAHDIAYATVRQSIDKLIDNLVNITDETGEFLLKLECCQHIRILMSCMSRILSSSY